MPVFGNAFNLGCAAFGAVMAAVTGFLLRKENRRLDKLSQTKYANSFADPSQEEVSRLILVWRIFPVH